MENNPEADPCKTEVANKQNVREEIPDIVDELVTTCDTEVCFDHVGPEPISSKEAIIEIIDKVRPVLFPAGNYRVI